MFPIYLFPVAPFRRRKSPASNAHLKLGSTSLTVEATASSLDSAAGTFLQGQSSLLRCGRCACDLCPTSVIVSRGFTGRWGRAYLVSAPSVPPDSYFRADVTGLPNTHVHKPTARQLVTGAHTVSDVSCAFCGNVLGWKYVDAEEESQKYKVGKFILETKRVSVATCWEQEGTQALEESYATAQAGLTGVEALEFDSQDEDECEDLFSGKTGALGVDPALTLVFRRVDTVPSIQEKKSKGFLAKSPSLAEDLCLGTPHVSLVTDLDAVDGSNRATAPGRSRAAEAPHVPQLPLVVCKVQALSSDVATLLKWNQ